MAGGLPSPEVPAAPSRPELQHPASPPSLKLRRGKGHEERGTPAGPHPRARRRAPQSQKRNNSSPSVAGATRSLPLAPPSPAPTSSARRRLEPKSAAPGGGRRGAGQAGRTRADSAPRRTPGRAGHSFPPALSPPPLPGAQPLPAREWRGSGRRKARSQLGPVFPLTRVPTSSPPPADSRRPAADKGAVAGPSLPAR